MKQNSRKKEGNGMSNKIEELMDMVKINELVGKKEEPKKETHPVVWVLAIVGAVVAVAGIAYAVYRYFAPDYYEEYEDFDDDDFDDDFYEDEDEAEK